RRRARGPRALSRLRSPWEHYRPLPTRPVPDPGGNTNLPSLPNRPAKWALGDLCCNCPLLCGYDGHMKNDTVGAGLIRVRHVGRTISGGPKMTEENIMIAV